MDKGTNRRLRVQSEGKFPQIDISDMLEQSKICRGEKEKTEFTVQYLECIDSRVKYS